MNNKAELEALKSIKTLYYRELKRSIKTVGSLITQVKELELDLMAAYDTIEAYKRETTGDNK